MQMEEQKEQQQEQELYTPRGTRVPRVSSCRGVAFEINPNKINLFAIESPRDPEDDNARWFWVPWHTRGSSLPVSLSSSLSPLSSSHFCDFDEPYSVGLENLLEDEIYVDEDLENQDFSAGEACTRDGVCGLRSNKQLLPRPEPRKKRSRLSVILLDQGLFTVYKRLLLLSLTLNVVMLCLAATGCFPYAKKKAALFSIGNILALTMCRSEAFLRVVFWLAVMVFGRHWMPIKVKTAVTAFLQGIGGIHSGCGISSIAWLVYALCLTLRDKVNTSPEIIGVAFTILALISLSSLLAFPLVRHLHHNVFERTHRFAGWSALALLWVFIILTTTYEPHSKSYDFHVSKLIKEQEFWYTFSVTILIILPWLTVRKVPVKVSAPSGHATLIRFEGGVKAGLLGRISPSPLSEWHAFGIISDGYNEHMMLAGAVGDFTKSLVSKPPSHLWVRKLHFAGLPYLVNMYQRVVLVATGSGICVFLSFLLQPSTTDVYFVWVANAIEQNFGKEIKEMVTRYPKEKLLIYDTSIKGRPNVAELSVDAAKSWDAEVLIVTSNPEGSRDVVKACNKAGIPAFGPIWDS